VKKFMILIGLVIMLFAPLVLLAQDSDAGTTGFDPEVLLAILAAGIFGLPIDKAIKFVKDKLNVSGVWVYLIEVIVCAVPVSIYQAATGFIVSELLIYTFFVFLSVHGWYIVKKPI